MPSSAEICEREYRSAVRSSCPPPSRESAGRLAAPPVVRKERGTSSRNRREWEQVSLFLLDRVVNP